MSGGMKCRLGFDKNESEVIGLQNIVHRYLGTPERFLRESVRFILRKKNIKKLIAFLLYWHFNSWDKINGE